MKRKLIILFVVALQISGCQKTKKAELPEIENGTKEIDRNGYSITYDSTFKLDESGRNGTEFFLFKPSKPGDEFAENINLMIQNLATLQYDLNQFVRLSEKQIKANGKLVESVRKKAGDQEYHVLIFEGNFNGLDLKIMQYDFVKNDKAYLLTFSAKRNEFDSHQKEVETVMNSFKLK